MIPAKKTAARHPRKKEPRRICYLQLRLTPEDRDTILRAAEEDGRSMHNFILRAALKAAREREAA